MTSYLLVSGFSQTSNLKTDTAQNESIIPSNDKIKDLQLNQQATNVAMPTPVSFIHMLRT
jgi:hypothetical protein